MSTERFNLILKDYPEEMKLSDKRRTLWYHETDTTIPKTIKEGVTDNLANDVKSKPYTTDNLGWIINRVSGEKVIKNSRTAGKPNMQKISGQSIWNGSVDMYARNNLKKFLSEYFRPSISRTLPSNLVTPAGEYFHFEFIFFVPIVARNWVAQDIDNHAYPYVKAFLDTVTAMKVIPDDSPRFLRGHSVRYVNCLGEGERRLEVKIHFCKNDQRIS
jgi:Holliday junction resolvase RusA-like endonuclease